jgi:hypothetical protein
MYGKKIVKIGVTFCLLTLLLLSASTAVTADIEEDIPDGTLIVDENIPNGALVIDENIPNGALSFTDLGDTYQ